MTPDREERARHLSTADYAPKEELQRALVEVLGELARLRAELPPVLKMTEEAKIDALERRSRPSMCDGAYVTTKDLELTLFQVRDVGIGGESELTGVGAPTGLVSFNDYWDVDARLLKARS